MTAQPLSPAEQAAVASILAAAERTLFWSQSTQDQRHAFDTMRRAEVRMADRTVVRAALLHDVGKGLVRLGAVGRSLATVADALHVPLRGRYATYRRHGALGAELLASAGSEMLVVEFAKRHPDPDPGPCDPEAWRALLEADHA